MEQGESSRARRRIKWAEDVIDNEGLGRKKSKGSCLAHTSAYHIRLSNQIDSLLHLPCPQGLWRVER